MAGLPTRSSSSKHKFNGFYFSNAIARIARGSNVGYILVSLAIVSASAVLTIIVGIDQQHLNSTILGHVFLFSLLLASRLFSNWMISLRDKLGKKTELKNRKRVHSQLNRLLSKYPFNPKLNLIGGALLILVWIILALISNRVEVLLNLLSYFFLFFFGFVVSIYFGVIYFLHVISKKIIGDICPLRALDPDRMGGYKFVADTTVNVIILSSILAGILAAAFGMFSIEGAGSPLHVFLSILIIVIVLISYVYITYDMHQGLIEEKEQIIARITPILLNVEKIIGAIAEDIQITERWEEVVEKISPYSMPILSLKVILDEVRFMRDWPIDVPSILKIVGGVSASIVVITFRTILQFLGIPIP